MFSDDFDPETATNDDLRVIIAMAIDVAHKVRNDPDEKSNVREYSLVQTHLETAGLWAIAANAKDMTSSITDALRGI